MSHAPLSPDQAGYAPLTDKLINEHLGRPSRLNPTYAADVAAIEAVRAEEAELNRIRRMSTTGTAENWLRLPDTDKAMTFALAIEESARRKDAEAEAERLRDELRKHACAELEALQKAPPRKPTAEMLVAGANASIGYPEGSIGIATAVYHAMLTAAQTTAAPSNTQEGAS